MPIRKVPLVTEEIYHVFNRGINRQPTFLFKRDYQRAIQSIQYYCFSKPPLRLSKFLILEQSRQDDLLKSLASSEALIDTISFCLMPNHFHLLLRQKAEKGISKFLANFQNSYTRYFNTKHNRDGALFLTQFKAVRIETEEQLIHVSRYIHLNPCTGFVVNSTEELKHYPWSSFPNYCNNSTNTTHKDLVDLFPSKEMYQKFVLDQADYQKELSLIKHLSLD
ncbi:MAG: transposase [Candidatus Daviesbacteria bacterium]|nr:transposase [Candidatus Daviesbacteria bacterium]